VVQVAVNQTQRLGEGRQVAQQLQAVIERFVQRPDGGTVKINYLGEIPSDPSVRHAVQRRQLLLINQPGSPAALALLQLASKLPSGPRR
jgi:flagellar biosynthesis protein FlhG